MTQHKEFPLCHCCDQEQTLSRISPCSVPLSPNQGVQGIYCPSKTGSVVLGGAGVLHIQKGTARALPCRRGKSRWVLLCLVHH